MTPSAPKSQVRAFYDQVGWKEVSAGLYQNAKYEDLRPVSREYIEKCHLRVKRYLPPQGKYLLDAGSGPIQYPAYLTYSEDYQYRVCADISIVALQEARKRIGEHGLYVVADVANLPFKDEAFDGVVSLHTIHHLPREEHPKAYRELYRTLKPGGSGVAVNGWGWARFSRWVNLPIRVRKIFRRLRGALVRRLRGGQAASKGGRSQAQAQLKVAYADKYDYRWLLEHVGKEVPLEIRVWRSVNTSALRFYIHPWLGGRGVLRALFALEERFPRFLGKHGAYPLVVFRK
ncbi:MAG TPA: class I SAM-dependent methyltransferase [Chloroflexi bacterium]|nr:class I SAM-dependent methyltransferase [Chloroflexota bacterium]